MQSKNRLAVWESSSRMLVDGSTDNHINCPSLGLLNSVEAVDEHLEFTHKTLENAAASEPDTRSMR